MVKRGVVVVIARASRVVGQGDGVGLGGGICEGGRRVVDG